MSGDLMRVVRKRGERIRLTLDDGAQLVIRVADIDGLAGVVGLELRVKGAKFKDPVRHDLVKPESSVGRV